MATNTCLLYGTTSWLNINLLIILIAFMLVAVFYALSNMLPTTNKEKLKDAARSEFTQACISVLIIAILASVATTACSISSGLSMALTGKQLNPFAYSEYYVGNLSANTGLNLLTHVYSTSVTYALEAQTLLVVGGFLNTLFSSALKLLFATTSLNKVITVTISDPLQLASLFTILSDMLLAVIGPLVTIVVGLLFLQFLLLPVLQYTAFAVILPVAIAMRSLAFMGTPLKSASNTVLALAIAGYIIYPLMISFNAYAITWIFSSQNPSAQYVKLTCVVPNIPISSFFSQLPLATSSGTGTSQWISTLLTSLSSTKLFLPFVTSSFNSVGIIEPWNVVTTLQLLINQVAQFIFVGVVLFVMDIAVTLGFAIGLSKALNSGLEGVDSFWGGI
jgi:hypothetical protein